MSIGDDKPIERMRLGLDPATTMEKFNLGMLYVALSRVEKDQYMVLETMGISEARSRFAWSLRAPVSAGSDGRTLAHGRTFPRAQRHAVRRWAQRRAHPRAPPPLCRTDLSTLIGILK